MNKRHAGKNSQEFFHNPKNKTDQPGDEQKSNHKNNNFYVILIPAAEVYNPAGDGFIKTAGQINTKRCAN